MSLKYHLSCIECTFEETIEVEEAHAVLKREEQHRQATNEAHLVEFELVE